MLWALIAIVLLIIWFVVFVDVFRRHDLGAWSKVLWAVGVVIIPVLGVIAYLIARPAGATDSFRVTESVAVNDEQLRGRHPV